MNDTTDIVHILIFGFTLCGDGRTTQLPEGHRWTDPELWEHGTCPKCLIAREQLIAELGLQPSPAAAPEKATI